MKLIIQIPCYNEEGTLEQTFKDLPKQIPGVDIIETQIIDDGSTDNTVKVARELGIDHIISFKNNKGLATVFKVGADNALDNGADILVNTDGDNQYCGHDIPKLVAPIIEGKADIVVGSRPIKDHPEFSPLKKSLQRFGSGVLRTISKTRVRDAASGFRAYNKTSLMHLNIYSKFSYCMETLIQAGHSNMKIASVNIRVNPKTRESRLFKGIIEYLYKSGKTMIGIYMLYRAKVFFFSMAAITFSIALILALRYLILIVFYQSPQGQFWPSIILAGILLGLSFQMLFTGMLASLIASNRKLSEEINYRLKKLDYED